MPRRKRPQLRQGEFYRLLDTFAKRILTDALDHAGGNRTYAAATLGLTRTYLVRLLSRYEVQDYSRLPGWHPNGRSA